jgi:integrase
MSLTARRVQTLTRRPGLHGDGGNLWLKVSGPGKRSWVFRYMIAGRARSMGLGHADEVPLAEARNKAEAARRLLRDGVDPREQRDATRAAAARAAARAITFSDVTSRYFAAQQGGWRSVRHRAIWRASVANHVEHLIGKLPVEKIDTSLVLRVLEPLWQTKPETASRLRGRIEAILSYAIARGWRDGPNPAVWRGHLQRMLPAPRKLRPVEHFAALGWHAAPAFIAELRQKDSIGARALHFAILTAVRSGEVRGATWDEIDMKRTVWTIPARRMKGGREHRVPLSTPALVLLRSMALLRTEHGLVFPGRSLTRPLSPDALTKALQRLGRGDLTAHGFRSTFRDWCADTGKSADAAEMALAHAPASRVVAAYARSDLLEQRRALMEAWAAFLGRPAAEVLPLRKRRPSR